MGDLLEPGQWQDEAAADSSHTAFTRQLGREMEYPYEVEFSDDEGETYAELALEPHQLLVLHHRPQHAA